MWLVSLMVNRAVRAKVVGSNPMIVTMCQCNIYIVLIINIEPVYNVQIADSVLIRSKMLRYVQIGIIFTVYLENMINLL